MNVKQKNQKNTKATNARISWDDNTFAVQTALQISARLGRAITVREILSYALRKTYKRDFAISDEMLKDFEHCTVGINRNDN